MYSSTQNYSLLQERQSTRSPSPKPDIVASVRKSISSNVAPEKALLSTCHTPPANQQTPQTSPAIARNPVRYMPPSAPWSGLALHELQDEVKARQLFHLWKPDDRQYLIAILKSNDREFFNSIQAHRGRAFAL